jgi:HAD superfamily hydrolase (TIGR01509 family)
MMKTNDALQAVVFDLDGVIANTEDLYEEASQIVLSRRGKTYDAVLREQMMGRPAIVALQLMIDCHSLPDAIEDLMSECKSILEAPMSASLAAMPGLEELLDTLQAAEIPLAVATSSTTAYADQVLSRLGVKDRFRFVLTADDIRRGKPDPEIFLLAATTIGFAPRQVMVLEDSANGCRAAVAAGAFTVAVPNRHTRQHTFPGAQFVADTLADSRIRRAFGIAD